MVMTGTLILSSFQFIEFPSEWGGFEPIDEPDRLIREFPIY